MNDRDHDETKSWRELQQRRMIRSTSNDSCAEGSPPFSEHTAPAALSRPPRIIPKASCRQRMVCMNESTENLARDMTLLLRSENAVASPSSFLRLSGSTDELALKGMRSDEFVSQEPRNVSAPAVVGSGTKMEVEAVAEAEMEGDADADADTESELVSTPLLKKARSGPVFLPPITSNCGGGGACNQATARSVAVKSMNPTKMDISIIHSKSSYASPSRSVTKQISLDSLGVHSGILQSSEDLHPEAMNFVLRGSLRLKGCEHKDSRITPSCGSSPKLSRERTKNAGMGSGSPLLLSDFGPMVSTPTRYPSPRAYRTEPQLVDIERSVLNDPSESSLLRTRSASRILVEVDLYRIRENHPLCGFEDDDRMEPSSDSGSHNSTS